MSTQIAVTTSGPLVRPATQASFPGIMRGEFLKIRRIFWPMLALLTAGFLISFLLNAQATGGDLRHAPLTFFYNSLESNMVIVRILAGILLLVLTSFTIGREYQYGTIRILLARGAGRVQLLCAKLVILALIALALLALFTLLTMLLTCVRVLTIAGNLGALSALTPTFWANSGIDLLTVMLSMGATILMAAAMNALGRSLTFGLSVSLIWFPVDNIGTVVMNALTKLTHNAFWINTTAYFLGPLLNRLPSMLLPAAARNGFESFGTEPLVVVSGSHALWVIGVYALVFLAIALVPTWKRDVKE
ncbi:MAG TPA: ABC transporter permease [Ktedonobacteraceae bacterium]|nr:ABC transporter permease [Ktedonobacteraceae bacterium]